MSVMRVVVTGALGRIGRLLTEELRAGGAHVIGVDVSAGADFQLDLAAMGSSVPPALAEADAIAHLETFNLGPAAAFSFDDAVGYMARRWKLPFVAVDLPLTPYQYETSVEKARRILGYAPRHTIFDMIDAATDEVLERV